MVNSSTCHVWAWRLLPWDAAGIANLVEQNVTRSVQGGVVGGRLLEDQGEPDDLSFESATLYAAIFSPLELVAHRYLADGWSS